MATVKDERQRALDAAISQIQKNYGQGSIMKLGDSMSNMNIEVIPTGSLSLDIALGVGGIPRGRIIEIYGPESSGKTTVALHMVAQAQKLGGIAGFVDAEHALDPKYAKNLGVNIDDLYISQPDNGEQALEIAETMVRSGAYSRCGSFSMPGGLQTADASCAVLRRCRGRAACIGEAVDAGSAISPFGAYCAIDTATAADPEPA